MKTEQVAEIIQGYAKQNIYIEVVCDGFKLDMPCYRGIIHYLKHTQVFPLDVDELWYTDDIGCYGEDWQAAFDEVVKYAERLKTKER